MMKHSRYQLIVLSVLITSLGNPAVAQEGGGGGESPAESSVSTSSSKKSKAAPEAIESNPVVTVVRAGINLSTAKKMGISGVRKIAKAGGSFKNLRHVSKAIGTGSVDHTHVIAAVDAGLTGGGDGANLHFLKAAGKIKEGTITTEHLNSLATTLGGDGMNFDTLFNDHGFSKDNADQFASAITKGYTNKHFADGLNITHVSDAISKNITISAEDASRYATHLADGKDINHIETTIKAGYSDDQIKNKTADELKGVAAHLDSNPDLTPEEADAVHNSGVDTTVTTKLLTAGIPADLVSSVAALNLGDDLLAKLSSNLSKGVSLTTINSKGITVVYNALAAGYTTSEVETFDKDKLTQLVAMIQAGVIKSDADAYQSFGLSLVSAVSLSNVQNTVLKSTINNVLEDATYTAPTHQAALTSAASIADMILKDVTIKSSSDLPTSINMASFAGNGYNTELVKLLVKYGAVGTNGSALATAALNGFSTTANSFSDIEDLLSATATTSDYLSLLSTLTGNNDLGDPDGDDDNFMKSSVLKVSLDKINLIPGSTMTLGSKGSVSSIDVSSQLTKSTSTADRKILVIGAAKDMTIAGDVTFTNTNDVEDHALAIGAADDFYLRSEYSQANNADYDNPAPINVKYTGSNLGLGSEDTMRLVNVNIETGGNLAISSLNELHIGLSDSHSSTFSVGTGGKNSDPDNVYLVANNLIQVNGLNFSGRLDDVYMEAITINLKDVAFPSTADVMLRSRDGTLHFNTFNNRVVGGVNLTNVSHGAVNLSPAHFDNGPAGHIDSTIQLPNGTAAIKIRKQ